MTKKRILCIDDESEIIELTRLLLTFKGFEVSGVLGGTHAIQTIRQQKPNLVLLDVMMPGISGWDIYRQMKADPDLTDIPVIMVTAQAQSIDKALGLYAAKVADYITKPFGPDELISSIERVLNSVP